MEHLDNFLWHYLTPYIKSEKVALTNFDFFYLEETVGEGPRAIRDQVTRDGAGGTRFSTPPIPRLPQFCMGQPKTNAP